MKIRTLIVDDSVVVRRVLADLISSDPALEVVGLAANGRIALEKIPQVNPDVVTLDIEMPEMDGLQALALVRRHYPRLPVIILSSFSERGAAVTLDALVLGASDYVTKPAHAGSAAIATAQIRNDLLPKIKSLCGRTEFQEPHLGRVQGAARWKSPVSAAAAPPRGKLEIVAIGVSTGGPNALSEIVSTFPADFPVPVVIVQHMPPVFTRILAERLSSRASVHIREGVEGGELTPGSVWIAPGNHHMEIARAGDAFRLKLNQGPPQNSCRPAVDVLFRSVAATHGGAALAVVLTGMGQDGLRGCEAIAQAGGQILAQDEASSVVWGMPGFVAKAGLADRVVPLSQLGGEILHRVLAGRTKPDGLARERLHRVNLGS